MTIRDNLIMVAAMTTLAISFFAYINPYVAIVSVTKGVPEFWSRELFVHLWPFLFVVGISFFTFWDYLVGNDM